MTTQDAPLDPQRLTDALNRVLKKHTSLAYAGFIYGETGAEVAREYAALAPSLDTPAPARTNFPESLLRRWENGQTLAEEWPDMADIEAHALRFIAQWIRQDRALSDESQLLGAAFLRCEAACLSDGRNLELEWKMRYNGAKTEPLYGPDRHWVAVAWNEHGGPSANGETAQQALDGLTAKLPPYPELPPESRDPAVQRLVEAALDVEGLADALFFIYGNVTNHGSSVQVPSGPTQGYRARTHWVHDAEVVAEKYVEALRHLEQEAGG